MAGSASSLREAQPESGERGDVGLYGPPCHGDPLRDLWAGEQLDDEADDLKLT